METIFRKVSVNDRLPKEDGKYITNYCLETKLLSCECGTCNEKRKWKIKVGGDTLEVTPDYWLEEIKLPTDEEIISKIDLLTDNQANFANEKGIYSQSRAFDTLKSFVKWMRLAVTAKDNVF